MKYVKCSCGENALLLKEYGDGCVEPKEEVYICNSCGRVWIWRQGIGLEED